MGKVYLTDEDARGKPSPDSRHWVASLCKKRREGDGNLVSETDSGVLEIAMRPRNFLNTGHKCQGEQH